MKKVLIISNSSSGLYEFRNEIVMDLLKDFEVYITLPDADHYYEIFENEGCHMIHIPFQRRGMNPIKDYKLFRSYKALIKQVRPDVVCTYTIKPNVYGGLACTITHTPYICNVTGLGTAIENGGILSKVLITMYRVALNRARCVFFQNSHNRDFMQSHGIARNTAKMLPGSGVNLEGHSYKPYPDEADGIRILAVLRVMDDKGAREFLSAVEELGAPSGEPKVTFELAGNYEEETRDVYEPQISRLINEGKLNYLGFVDDMDSVYEKCHILVHPSYHEGLSNVCLEAAACGRPVLASDVPGCRETLNDELTGLLFEARNSEALICSLKKILSYDSARREDMGKKGREYVEKNFSREIVIRMYRNIIEEITGGKDEI